MRTSRQVLNTQILNLLQKNTATGANLVQGRQWLCFDPLVTTPFYLAGLSLGYLWFNFVIFCCATSSKGMSAHSATWERYQSTSPICFVNWSLSKRSPWNVYFLTKSTTCPVSEASPNDKFVKTCSLPYNVRFANDWYSLNSKLVAPYSMCFDPLPNRVLTFLSLSREGNKIVGWLEIQCFFYQTFLLIPLTPWNFVTLGGNH